jgi:hypothetical protein
MEEETAYSFPSKYRIASVIVVVGALAVLDMLILSFFAPEEALTLDQAGSIAEFYTTVAEQQNYALLQLILDTVFIAGYTALFAGLWLIIRDFSDIIAHISLALGLIVAFGDLLENAILFALVLGIPNGWNPEPSIFNIVWTANLLIDITSYVAAIFFGLQFIIIFMHNRLKLIIGVLFVSYAVIGLLTLLEPAFFLVRTALFVIGLGLGAYMLFNEHELSDEELLGILQKSSEKTDYIR